MSSPTLLSRFLLIALLLGTSRSQTVNELYNQIIVKVLSQNFHKHSYELQLLYHTLGIIITSYQQFDNIFNEAELQTLFFSVLNIQESTKLYYKLSAPYQLYYEVQNGIFLTLISKIELFIAKIEAKHIEGDDLKLTSQTVAEMLQIVLSRLKKSAFLYSGHVYIKTSYSL